MLLGLVNLGSVTTTNEKCTCSFVSETTRPRSIHAERISSVIHLIKFGIIVERLIIMCQLSMRDVNKRYI